MPYNELLSEITVMRVARTYPTAAQSRTSKKRAGYEITKGSRRVQLHRNIRKFLAKNARLESYLRY